MSTTHRLSKKIEVAVRQKLLAERRAARDELKEARQRLRRAESELTRAQRIEAAAFGRHDRGPRARERWETAHKRLQACTAAHFGYFDRVRRLEREVAKLYDPAELPRRLHLRADNEAYFGSLSGKAA